jgi:Ca-activated chloride channel family protein
MKRAGLAVLAVVLASAMALAESGEVARLNEEGNRLYDEGRFEDALARYAEGLVMEPDSRVLHYNMGNALYRLGRVEEAIREYAAASRESRESASLGTAAPFNEGTARLTAGNYEEAVERLRDVLLQAPADEDARHNLELALARLQEQQAQQERQKESQQEEGEQGEEGEAAKGDEQRDQQEQSDENQHPRDGEESPDEEASPMAPQPQGGETAQEPEEAPRPETAEELSREEARRLLEALARDERADLKETLERPPAKKQKATRDW